MRAFIGIRCFSFAAPLNTSGFVGGVKPQLQPLVAPILEIIYSRFHGFRKIGRIFMILLVGAARFELTTPCAQGRCATRLRYAPTSAGLFILDHFQI